MTDDKWKEAVIILATLFLLLCLKKMYFEFKVKGSESLKNLSYGSFVAENNDLVKRNERF